MFLREPLPAWRNFRIINIMKKVIDGRNIALIK